MRRHDARPGAATRVRFLVVGTPRSGTTLVQRSCDDLADVSVVGETHFFRQGLTALRDAGFEFPISKQSLPASIRVWLDLPVMMGAEVDPVDVMDRLHGSCDSAGDLFVAIVESLGDDSAGVLGEKTPSHLRHWSRINDELPGIRFVWVVRDPRDVARSLVDVPWGERDLVAAAARWRRDMRTRQRALATLGSSRVLTVRFEDMVGCPKAEQERIAHFLGVDPIVQPATPETRTTLAHDWEWWKSKALLPTDADRAEAWRRDPKAVATIEHLCSREMRSVGYDVSTSPLRRGLAGISDPALWRHRTRRLLHLVQSKRGQPRPTRSRT